MTTTLMNIKVNSDIYTALIIVINLKISQVSNRIFKVLVNCLYDQYVWQRILKALELWKRISVKFVWLCLSEWLESYESKRLNPNILRQHTHTHTPKCFKDLSLFDKITFKMFLGPIKLISGMSDWLEDYFN